MPTSNLNVTIPDNVSVPEFILNRIKQYGSKVALIDSHDDRQYTYMDVYKKIVSAGSALRRRGFRQGDVVLFYCSNSIDYPIMMLAVSSIGGVVTTANPAYTVEELVRQIKDSNVTYIITDTDAVTNVRTAVKHVKTIKEIIINGDAAKDCVAIEVLYSDNGDQFQLARIDPVNDLCLVPYSSGTTGPPKGVMLTHYNFLHPLIVVGMKEAKTFRNIGKGTMLVFLPLFHIFGILVVFVGLSNGEKFVILRKFDFVHMLSSIQKYKVTTLPIVPPIAVMLAKDERVSNYDLSSLDNVFSGAASLMQETTEEIRKRLNFVVRQGYGMTETSSLTTLSQYDNVKQGSVGIVAPTVECEIFDVETGRQLGVSESGEVCVRTKANMKGYLNNDLATKQIIDEKGWLHTGDIGHFDEDGHLYITGRLKELIKYNGLQVAPAELEAILLEHPDVTDVAVIGIPDELTGELPKAFVVRRNDSVKESDIVNFLQDKVAPHKRLRGGVEFVTQIPKSPSGKILRRVLLDNELSKQSQPKSKL